MNIYTIRRRIRATCELVFTSDQKLIYFWSADTKVGILTQNPTFVVTFGQISIENVALILLGNII